MSSRAIFMDRDGTLVEPRHYPSRPEDLRLYAGIGVPLRRLQQLGFRLVVVTNQSGIARGYFSEADLASMHVHLAEELAAFGVRLDAVYYCAHHPEGSVPELSVRCECRKPEPGMLRQSAADLDLDLHASWLVGDILDDIEAGKRAGCKTVLVDLGTEAFDPDRLRRPDFVTRSTREALQLITRLEFAGMAQRTAAPGGARVASA